MTHASASRNELSECADYRRLALRQCSLQDQETSRHFESIGPQSGWRRRATCVLDVGMASTVDASLSHLRSFLVNVLDCELVDGVAWLARASRTFGVDSSSLPDLEALYKAVPGARLDEPFEDLLYQSPQILLSQLKFCTPERWVFEFRSSAGISAPIPPRPRRAHCAVLRNGRELLVCGGYTVDEDLAPGEGN